MLLVVLERITVVGAGFHDDLFHTRSGVERPRGHLLYAGKLAQAKGLPWLLEAVEALAARRPEVVLHVAGGGSGAEAEELRQRMEALGSVVRFHGRLG